jgi:hypothetical protein
MLDDFERGKLSIHAARYIASLEDAETVAANAVQAMDKQLTDAKLMLAAVVLAAGGDVRVGQRDLIHSRDVVMTIGDDPANGGVRVTVHRQL